MSSQRVLVVGGRGYFGQLLIDDLLSNVDCDVTVASRRPFRSDRFNTVVADLHDLDSLERALREVTIAICAAGPYQSLPTTLAELCLKVGIHYIDLADDREFVRKVRTLTCNHPDAIGAICTGW